MKIVVRLRSVRVWSSLGSDCHEELVLLDGCAGQRPTEPVKGGRGEIMSDPAGPTTAQGPPCR